MRQSRSSSTTRCRTCARPPPGPNSGPGTVLLPRCGCSLGGPHVCAGRGMHNRQDDAEDDAPRWASAADILRGSDYRRAVVPRARSGPSGRHQARLTYEPGRGRYDADVTSSKRIWGRGLFARSKRRQEIVAGPRFAQRQPTPARLLGPTRCSGSPEELGGRSPLGHGLRASRPVGADGWRPAWCRASRKATASTTARRSRCSAIRTSSSAEGRGRTSESLKADLDDFVVAGTPRRRRLS